MRLAALGVCAAAACSGTAAEPAHDPAPVSPPSAPAEAPAATASAASTPPPPEASAAPTAPTAKKSAQGACASGMVELAGGTFKSSYFKKEMSVGPFCIDVNMVTNAEYAACVTAGKCSKDRVTVCDPPIY